MEQVTDRIGKEYVSEIASCVGAALFKGWQMAALDRVIQHADLEGEDRE